MIFQFSLATLQMGREGGFIFKSGAVYIAGILLLAYLKASYLHVAIQSHFRTSDMSYRTKVAGHNLDWEIATKNGFSVLDSEWPWSFSN